MEKIPSSSGYSTTYYTFADNSSNQVNDLTQGVSQLELLQDKAEAKKVNYEALKKLSLIVNNNEQQFVKAEQLSQEVKQKLNHHKANIKLIFNEAVDAIFVGRGNEKELHIQRQNFFNECLNVIKVAQPLILKRLTILSLSLEANFLQKGDLLIKGNPLFENVLNHIYDSSLLFSEKLLSHFVLVELIIQMKESDQKEANDDKVGIEIQMARLYFQQLLSTLNAEEFNEKDFLNTLTLFVECYISWRVKMPLFHETTK